MLLITVNLGRRISLALSNPFSALIKCQAGAVYTDHYAPWLNPSVRVNMVIFLTPRNSAIVDN